MGESMNLAAAIGRRLREVRLEHGWSQADVAHAARAWGLRWSRATVASIETGRRDLSASELVLLPPIFVALTDPEERDAIPELAELVPDVGIELARDAAPVPPDVVRAVLSGRFRDYSRTAEIQYEDKPVEADARAAMRLGMTVNWVLVASYKLWGRSLIEERDRRVGERGLSSRDESIRPVRSQVTRGLIEELRVHEEAERQETARMLGLSEDSSRDEIMETLFGLRPAQEPRRKTPESAEDVLRKMIATGEGDEPSPEPEVEAEPDAVQKGRQ